MENLAARAVFFVRDAERALEFYTGSLGFALDWTHQEGGRAFVVQVSLFGLQLILNQIEPAAGTQDRPGHGRVFIGLDPEQVEPFRGHVAHQRIPTTVVQWGAPTLVIHDQDGNELFFWLPEEERASLVMDGR
jgi:catechol 2,3-dioxygenase-like lactoylglutathione lyase family enzyme